MTSIKRFLLSTIIASCIGTTGGLFLPNLISTPLRAEDRVVAPPPDQIIHYKEWTASCYKNVIGTFTHCDLDKQ